MVITAHLKAALPGFHYRTNHSRSVFGLNKIWTDIVKWSLRSFLACVQHTIFLYVYIMSRFCCFHFWIVIVSVIGLRLKVNAQGQFL